MSYELKKAQRIKDIFPMTNSIFTKMNFTFRAEVTKASLDLMFYTDYGNRCPSPLVEEIQSEYEEALSSTELQTLADIAVEMYGPRWTKLGQIYGLDYDPIHNYLDTWSDSQESTETGSRTIDSTRTDSYGHVIDSDNTRTDNTLATTTYGRTDTRTDNLTEESDSDTSTSGTSNSVDGVWGYNSTNAVNRSKTDDSDTSTVGTESTRTNTGTQTNVSSGSDELANTGTVTDDGTVTHSGTDTRGLDSDESNTLEGERTREGEHSGNIGNITTQKMITEEINLWRWNYVQSILGDIKELCTIPVYVNLNHLRLVEVEDD